MLENIYSSIYNYGLTSISTAKANISKLPPAVQSVIILTLFISSIELLRRCLQLSDTTTSEKSDFDSSSYEHISYDAFKHDPSAFATMEKTQQSFIDKIQPPKQPTINTETPPKESYDNFAETFFDKYAEGWNF